MAALLVDRLPVGSGWMYEPKLDGYRAMLIKDGAAIQVRSRNDNDFARSFPAVAKAAARLHAERVVIDGEIVAIDARGHPSFQALQHRGTRADYRTVFYAFDVPYLEGDDLRSRPLVERRAYLPVLLEDTDLLLSPELPGTPEDILRAVRALGLEGAMAKRRDSIYEAGERSGAWVKVRVNQQQEFVIGGYRAVGNSVDALLVGYYEGKALRFGGKVRAGFVPHARREVFRQLAPLGTARCPFPELPIGRSHWGGGVTAEEMNEMRWVRPEAVAQISFLEWTAEGRLRHAKFLGMRTDKAATSVVRERPEVPDEIPERFERKPARKATSRR